MTMDNDPELFNPTPPRRSYNPFECDDEKVDALGMESVEVSAKEDHNGFDLSEFEESAKSLSFLTENDDSLWEESIAGVNDHTSSFQKDIAVDEGVCILEKVSHELDVLQAPKPKLSGECQKDSALCPDKDSCMDGLNRDFLVSYKSTDQKPDFSVDCATMKNASTKLEPDSEGKNGADQEVELAKQENCNSAMEETIQQNKVNLEETKTETEERNLPKTSATNSNDTNQDDNPKSAEPARNSASASAPHFPSSITFLGPVAFSGNASIRSESSTGSTRSFAFPVLQNEWNSSPVRMAKADQRWKKHKSWMQSLVCCRF